MPSNRHITVEGDLAVRAMGLHMPSDFEIDHHNHDWPQLLYAKTGALQTSVPAGRWLVTPQRGVWIPPCANHAINMVGEVTMRTLYLHPNLPLPTSRDCLVFALSPLLIALIDEAVRMSGLRTSDASQANLIDVLVDQLAAARDVPFDIPLPTDERAIRIAERVLADPGAQLSLEELSDGCGASPRTIERIFQKQTKLTFGRWRQQVRLTHSISMLTRRASVTEAALACGYESTSAFIAMFKKSLGQTPTEYLAAQKHD